MRPFSGQPFSCSASNCVRENSARQPDADGHVGKGRGAAPAPSRRDCPALSSAPKALGNHRGVARELLLFRFEFLQRLGAAHTHFLLMTFKTMNNPAAARLDAFAQPL